MTDNDMVYASVAKGYRMGGTNAPLTAATCAIPLAGYGLTINDIPTTYGSDTVWSYEAGAKTRLLQNRLQMNVAAYRIDWTDLQSTLNINTGGCGIPWVQNVGAARSEGVDFEAQAQVVDGLVLGLAVGYNKAFYTQPALGPKPLNGTATIFAAKGQKLPVRPWNIQFNARYEFDLNSKMRGYLRGDWTYVPGYRITEFGTVGYSPDNSVDTQVQFRNHTNLVNFKAGVLYKDIDLSLFVFNVFESRDGTPIGGRSGCAVASGAACTTFNTYNPLFSLTTFEPRRVGLEIAYRF
jgi:outer membrane receptor protein involved in Fe transport